MVVCVVVVEVFFGANKKRQGPGVCVGVAVVMIVVQIFIEKQGKLLPFHEPTRRDDTTTCPANTRKNNFFDSFYPENEEKLEGERGKERECERESEKGRKAVR